METPSLLSPQSVIEQLQNAQNRHDLEAFLAWFDPDYESEQPVHPDRVFGGREQVRKNWATLFNSIPDFQAGLLASAADGDTVWSEWHWFGSRDDGSRFDMRGVTIFGVRAGRIVWGRLYMEPVQEMGAGIDATVKSLAGGSGQEG